MRIQATNTVSNREEITKVFGRVSAIVAHISELEEKLAKKAREQFPEANAVVGVRSYSDTRNTHFTEGDAVLIERRPF